MISTSGVPVRLHHSDKKRTLVVGQGFFRLRQSVKEKSGQFLLEQRGRVCFGQI